MPGDRFNRAPRFGNRSSSSGNSGNFGNFGNRRPAPPSNRPPRPPAKSRAKGPATLVPKHPADSAELRQMLKAAAWRLARFLRQPPAKILASPDPVELVEQAEDLGHERGSGYGEARRLAVKIARLKAGSGKQA